MNDTTLKWISILSIVTGVGLLLFWIGFFTIGLAPDNPPRLLRIRTLVSAARHHPRNALIAASALMLNEALGRHIALVCSAA